MADSGGVSVRFLLAEYNPRFIVKHNPETTHFFLSWFISWDALAVPAPA